MPPGTVGIIRIAGPTQLTVRPEEEGVKEEVKPDTVVVGEPSSSSTSDIKTSENERRPTEEPKEKSKDNIKE